MPRRWWFVGAWLAVTLLSACSVRNVGVPDVPARSSDAAAPPVDVRPTTTPRPGDCVGADSHQVWVVDCANHQAVARVTRQVPTGRSDECTTDDYVGFDFSNDKPSLCLMLYGRSGDCYSGFQSRMATGPRVDCADPKARLRLVGVVIGADRGSCDRLTPPGDPNATALFYGMAPDFDADPETMHDLTFCLASPSS